MTQLWLRFNTIWIMHKYKWCMIIYWVFIRMLAQILHIPAGHVIQSIFSLMNYVRNTLKLWKMPILSAASSEPSAICWSSVGSSFTWQVRNKQVPKTGSQAENWHQYPWYHRLVSKNTLPPRKIKQKRSATVQVMAIWCESNVQLPLIFPSTLQLPHASEVTHYHALI